MEADQRLRPIRGRQQQQRAVHEVQHEADHPDGGEDRQPHQHAGDQVAPQGNRTWRSAGHQRRVLRAACALLGLGAHGAGRRRVAWPRRPSRGAGLDSLASFAAGLASLASALPSGLASALASLGLSLALGLRLVLVGARQIALVLLVGLEVGLVPAAALQAEHRRRHQLLQLALAAGRALLQRRIGDLLHDLRVELAAWHSYS